jgi:hypothetical protein
MNTKNFQIYLDLITNLCKDEDCKDEDCKDNNILSNIMDLDNNIRLDNIEKCMNNLHEINPISIKVSMLYYIETLINNGVSMNKKNKDIIVVVVFILVCKYILGYDFDFSIEMNSLYCGISLEKYIKYEKDILKHLEWKLFIPEKEYNRLFEKLHFYFIDKE